MAKAASRAPCQEPEILVGFVGFGVSAITGQAKWIADLRGVVTLKAGRRLLYFCQIKASLVYP